jgi:hypothetical protein
MAKGYVTEDVTKGAVDSWLKELSIGVVGVALNKVIGKSGSPVKKQVDR